MIHHIKIITYNYYRLLAGFMYSPNFPTMRYAEYEVDHMYEIFAGVSYRQAKKINFHVLYTNFQVCCPIKTCACAYEKEENGCS